MRSPEICLGHMSGSAKQVSVREVHCQIFVSIQAFGSMRQDEKIWYVTRDLLQFFLGAEDSKVGRIPFPSKSYTTHFTLEWIQLGFQSEFCMRKQKINRQIYYQDSKIQI